jgi:hypothetical protein
MLTVVLKATRGDPQGQGPGARLRNGLVSQKGSASRAARPIVAVPPGPRGQNSPHGHGPAANRTTKRQRTRARQQPAAPHQILRAARPPRRSGLEDPATVSDTVLDVGFFCPLIPR